MHNEISIQASISMYICEHCLKQFRHRPSWHRHKTTKCGPKTKSNACFECDFCEKVFDRRDILSNHVKSVHQKERFACRFCSKELHRCSLLRHEKKCKLKPNQEVPSPCMFYIQYNSIKYLLIFNRTFFLSASRFYSRDRHRKYFYSWGRPFMECCTIYRCVIFFTKWYNKQIHVFFNEIWIFFNFVADCMIQTWVLTVNCMLSFACYDGSLTSNSDLVFFLIRLC